MTRNCSDVWLTFVIEGSRFSIVIGERSNHCKSGGSKQTINHIAVKNTSELLLYPTSSVQSELVQGWLCSCFCISFKLCTNIVFQRMELKSLSRSKQSHHPPWEITGEIAVLKYNDFLPFRKRNITIKAKTTERFNMVIYYIWLTSRETCDISRPKHNWLPVVAFWSSLTCLAAQGFSLICFVLLYLLSYWLLSYQKKEKEKRKENCMGGP